MLLPHQQKRRRAAQLFKKAGSSRVPLSHPLFNIREIAKHLLLLEDHLHHHYCSDCIRKHLLMVEALAEEASSLDEMGVYLRLCQGLAQMCRIWMERVSDSSDNVRDREIAQEVRQVRKKLVPMVYDPRGVEMQKRVASAALTRRALNQREGSLG